jgi:hypothetical protein
MPFVLGITILDNTTDRYLQDLGVMIPLNNNTGDFGMLNPLAITGVTVHDLIGLTSEFAHGFNNLMLPVGDEVTSIDKAVFPLPPDVTQTMERPRGKQSLAVSLLHLLHN